MRLYHQWIGGLAKDFKQVIVTNEVKARKQGSFFLMNLGLKLVIKIHLQLSYSDILH